MVKKLLDQVRDQIRVRHYSIKTTMIYTHIVKELNKESIKSPLDF